MADALVSIVMEQLTLVIRREFEQEVKLVVGVRHEVGKLIATLTMIQAVLDDAEEKQVKDKAVKLWLEKLKDIVYDANDVLDDWNTRMIISQTQETDDDADTYCVGIRRKVLSYLLSPCFCFKSVGVRHDIGHRIKEIRESLEVIAHEKDQYSLIVSQGHQQPRQITSSIVDVSEICGREIDKEIILSRLLGESSHQEMNVPIISIVGMGGFGKTTLAKLVFKEDKVETNFDKKMWVCVSEHFDLVRIAKSIIEQAEGKVPTADGWESLHQCLCDSLKGKRFLLVLDDIWTSDPDLWNALKVSLKGGTSGSRVVVTTRDEGVAEMMGSTYRHRLGKLCEEDCWLLFKNIAFSGRQADLEKFEEIGKQIAKKCKGVPLAARTIASLMWFKRSKQDWRDILASDIWEISEIEKGILPSLLMSYSALSSQLKQCFVYCAIFQKDTKLSKDFLVKLWMAQGFLGSDGRRELEIIGRECYDNLARRSFFQDFEIDFDGNITSCKMHDLIHDFAQFLTKTECVAMESNDMIFNDSRVRHICVDKLENPSIYVANKLRSLLRQYSYRKSKCTVPIELFHRLACLRALDLRFSGLKELPSEVGGLLHLRYLDLSGTKIRELPETMCNLQNLQTLDLNYCKNLQKLPEGLGKLSNLRHLELVDTNKLNHFPQGTGKLSFLRTLSKFIVSGASNGCKIKELKFLTSLRGNLEIHGLEQVSDLEEVIQLSKNLQNLVFSFARLEEDDYAGKMEGILENLQPHQNLEQMTIYGIPGSQYPSWIAGTSVLSNLTTLQLYRCKKCTKLLPLGKLASLEKLEIVGMCLLKQIGQEFYGFNDHANSSSAANDRKVVAFPKLKKLEFRRMEELNEWELPFSMGTKIMPCLLELTISFCPKLKALPSLGKLESLESLEIRHLPSIKHIGLEFFGMPSDDDKDERKFVHEQELIFPRLTKLEFFIMEEWEDLIVPFDRKHREIVMPCLHLFRVFKCPKLRALPDFTKFKSLETLVLDTLDNMEKLESGEQAETVLIKEVVLSYCPKINVIPLYLFSHTLRELQMSNCPKLIGVQPCLPPLLEKLVLVGDLGFFSKSLPLSDTNYPNLKFVMISKLQHPSLPKGFNQLTAIQELDLSFSGSLDFELMELRHLTKLQKLEIYECPVLEERFREGEDLSILSHVPRIEVERKILTWTNTGVMVVEHDLWDPWKLSDEDESE